ncbi:VWA domain-containing protein [Alkalilimnicola ehrlichii]|uniref:VWA domain-containing protein n=1 Tax=Alkalilimnicola ehrlichii TaxID=351052 RepID=A0A3E0X1D1_9GAMM|nr:VWA domain-containing protein [Alkalilimnicola ehrlichii]RFA30504.1 VWA domain-containing protein [Alkalilimnicola ehrlichii]RFA38055.1 VWA domain-containing protein [Alkalilimnicola ehrlichii]
MLIEFFFALRKGGLKVSLTEFLTLMEALQKRLAVCSVDDFYYLARGILVKDETLFDRFDQIFGDYFSGIETVFGGNPKEGISATIPEEWLRRQAERLLSEEEKAKIESLGGWDKLMETLRKRLEEQKERHQGGNKWIGTAGTSPFGAYGYNPEGIRIGQEGSRHRRAVKVWDKREFRNLDSTRELGTRNIKVALRRLRRFAREGAQEVLDMDDTIRSTARNAGHLDLKMVPERHNAVKVLLFFDVGGSMDDHIRVCEELFSAARAEFKHMEYFYFHNFIYEGVWKDARRRYDEVTPTLDVLNTYGSDYKVIVVGDATMSPYEILYPGASVEHHNEEAGATWLQRILDTYPKAIWLNPEPERYWSHTPSIKITRELMADRMYPLTLEGMDEGIRYLSR